MCRRVPPLQVSPFIKAARWSFLFCGIVYGIFKLHSYKLIELHLKPLREKQYQKKREELQQIQRIQFINDINIIAENLGITELPPGWEDDVTRSRIMERTLPPANVSPFIKGARWSLLVAGILYGSSRLNMLSKKEKKRLEELERTRPEREAKAKLEKERITKEQIEDLSKQLGVPV